MKGIHHLFLVLASALILETHAQNSVGIGIENSNNNAVLELHSPTGNQGFLVPRLSSVERLAMAANLGASENGLLIYDSDEGKFYYWHSSQWNLVGSGLQLTAGNGISITGNTITNTGDADADSTNELQELILNGNNLSITNNPNSTPVDLSPFVGVDTDDQELQFNANQLSLSDDPSGTVVDFSNYDNDVTDDFDGAFTSLTGTPATLADGDNQDLSLISNVTDRTVNITDGTGVTFSVADNDNSTTNEIQDLTFNAGVIALSSDPGGTTVDLSAYDSNVADDFDGAFTSLTGTPATLTDGDNQNLSLITNTTNRTVNITDGNGVTFSVADNDNSTTNEIQDLTFNAGVIALSSDPGATTIDLSAYDSNVADDFDGAFSSLTGVPINLDTDATDDFDGAFTSLTGTPTTLTDGDNQDLSLITNTTNRTVNITDGTGVTFSVADNDNSTSNEIQDLTFNSGVIALSNDPGGTTVDLSAYDSNVADDFDGAFSSLTGVPVNLDTDATDDFDGAFTSLTGTPATLTDGDNQNLSLITNTTDRTVNITDGTGVTFSVADNDNNASNEIQDLTFNAGVIALSSDPGATAVDLSAYDTDVSDDFDGAFTSLTGTPATLTDGDNQDLSLITNTTNRTVNITDGTGVTFSVADNDNSTTNEIQDLSLTTNTLSLSGDPSPVDLSAFDQDLSSSASGTDRTINITGGNSTTISVLDFTPSAFKASPNASQGISFGSPVRIIFNNILTPNYDTGNYDESNSQFVTPADGLYNFSGLITFNNPTSGPVDVILAVDGDESNPVYQKRVSGGTISLDFTCDLSLQQNNTVTVWVNTLVAGSISTADTPAPDIIYFSGRRFN